MKPWMKFLLVLAAMGTLAALAIVMVVVTVNNRGGAFVVETLAAYAVGLGIFAAVRWIVRWIIARRQKARQAADQVDVVAQAIARCYGHGPLARMDQVYQDEFRRDARAALDAMRRRR